MSIDNKILIDMYNKNKWKRTREKSYEVYVCRPEIGTETVDKLTGMKDKTDKNRQFIISGILGSRKVINIGSLISKYSNIDGTKIDTEQLKSKMTKSGQIDWFKVKISNKATYFAFHIPSSVKNIPIKNNMGISIANKTGIKHGCGDFLLCESSNGEPNFNTMRVVNGNIFVATYDMRAFPGIYSCDSIEDISSEKPKTILRDKKAVDKRSEAIKGNNKFEIVGRVERGNNVVGYSMKNVDTGNVIQVSKDVTIYLVGANKVVNCRHQFYKGKVILRGVGVDLNKLPVKKI